MTGKKPIKDRRAFPRARLRQTLSLADEKTLLLAEIYDITVGGVSLLAENDVKVGSRFYVIFPGAGGIRENELRAEVIRCEELNTNSAYRRKITAKFIDANPKYLEDAVALVQGKTAAASRGVLPTAE